MSGAPMANPNLGPCDLILLSCLASCDTSVSSTPTDLGREAAEPEMIVRRRLRRFVRDKLAERLKGRWPRYRITAAGRRALSDGVKT